MASPRALAASASACGAGWAPARAAAAARAPGRERAFCMLSHDAARLPATHDWTRRRWNCVAAAAADSAAAAAAAPPAAARDPALAFDWPLAVELAGCSFEAYNGLEEAAGGAPPPLRQTSPSGTVTTFVDGAFVRSRLAGILEVAVESAAGLRAARGEPYCVVAVGSSATRTPVATAGAPAEPSWGHAAELFVRDPRAQRLLVRVLAGGDLLTGGDLLGYGARGLADLGDGAERAVAVPLGAGAGEARLRLRFRPFAAGEPLGARMGGPVLGSPAAPLGASPWRGLRAAVAAAEAAADAAFDPVAFVENEETDTQAWVLWSEAARLIVIAFRGTEQVKIKDILTDLSVSPVTLDPEGAGVSAARAGAPASASSAADGAAGALGALLGGARALLGGALGGGKGAAATEAEPPRAWVHSGFERAYRSVRVAVVELVDAAVGADAEPWTVYVTGHSLGGALSTLCAHELGRRTAWRGAPPRVVNYSFGSPRVGNAAFAAELNAAAPNCWRVVNRADAVAGVPRLLGFAHVGHRVVLLPGGGAEVEWDSGEGAGEGAFAAEVAGAAVAAALAAGAAGALPADVAALVDAEVAAMAALLDGSGLADHLEDRYLESLTAAVAGRGDAERSG
jgi:hypothetical protein